MVNRRVSVAIDADPSGYNRALLGMSANTRAFVRDLESADGRLANLVQAGLAVAPAFVPLGAAVIPVVAGLASQLGAAAAAGGVAILAFQGVGDALDALNDYQLEPTEKNLEKLREKMATLGPAGQLFVRALQDLRPELQDLQDVAQAGMFPGLIDGIHELMEIQPEVESLIDTLARVSGGIAADAGGRLNDDDWVDFIGFLDREAAPTLKATARTLGLVLEGLANMMMDFDPLADSFTQGMVRYAESFRDWTEGLGETEGFEDFVDYIRENGPEAMETLQALGGALVSLVTAAAPVGEVVLPVIEALAEGLGALAESPVGPVLIGAAAAVGTLGRSLAILSAIGLRSGDSMLAKIFAVDKIKAGAAAMVDVTSAQDRARHSTAQLTAIEQKRAATFRSGAAQIGKNAALLGGLALATSGYAEKSGAANTATFALMGSIAGPWGAAVGGGIGLAMDFAAANNDLEKSIRSADAAIDSMDLSKMRTELTGLNDTIDATKDKLSIEASSNPFASSKENIEAMIAGVNELASGSLDEAQSKLEELESTNEALILGVNALGREFGSFRTGTYVEDLDRLNRVLEHARPAMEELGISAGDLADAVKDGSILDLVDQIAGYTRWMDSAAGRTARVANAMAGLDDQMISTKESATDLKTALDDLLDPNLNLVRATDEWTTALRHLDKDLAKNNKSIVGNSDAAIKNREAINQRVDSMKQLLGAEADAGASSEQLARKLKEQKKALIDAADAAGISRGQMVAYLKQLGLTPKLIKTLIKAETSDAEARVAAIKRALDGVKSKNVTVTVNYINKRLAGGADNDPTTPYSGGGYTGAGGKYDPAGIVHRGEFVFSKEATDGNVERLVSLHSQLRGYADGGPVGDFRSGQGIGSGLSRSADAAAASLGALGRLGERELRQRAHILDRQQRLAEKELEAAKDYASEMREQLKTMRDARREFAEMTAQNFRSDVFGDTDLAQYATDHNLGSGFGNSVYAFAQQQIAAQNAEAIANGQAPADPQAYNIGDWVQQYLDTLSPDQIAALQAQASIGTLNQDTHDAEEFERVLEQLRAMGLRGGAYAQLAASGNLAQAQAYLQMGPDYVHSLMQNFRERNNALENLGQSVGNARFGADIREQLHVSRMAARVAEQARDHLRDVVRAQKDIAQRLHRIEQNSPKETGAAVAGAINASVGHGQRR